MYWFTSDEHYAHQNIIKYCNRPFKDIYEMDETIINNFNRVVKKSDITIHAGDFTLLKDKKIIYEKYINRLNGKHIFLKGSHDYWIPQKGSIQRWEKNINGYYIVVDHYAYRVWPRSHYNSFMLYGHSHGNLEPVGKQWDLSVDNNNFFPLSEIQIIDIMKTRQDNPNLIK